MVIVKRTAVMSLLLSAGLLSACATTSESVITRTSQIDDILNQPERDCRYQLLRQSLVMAMRETAEGVERLRELDDICPGLAVSGDEADEQVLVLAAATTPTDTTDTTPAPDAPTDTTDAPATDTDNPDTTDTDAPTSDDGAGDDTTGDGRGSDGGKNGNNGGGNGSEGGSPGRGSGANQDE